MTILDSGFLFGDTLYIAYSDIQAGNDFTNYYW